MLTQLFGVWKLMNCRQVDIKNNELPDPFSDASGMLTYNECGLMSVQLMKKKHINNSRINIFDMPAANYKELFENYIAYYASYNIIDESKQILEHHVLGAQWPNMIGQVFYRQFQFEDKNTLILSPKDPEASTNKEPIMRYLTWRKVE